MSTEQLKTRVREYIQRVWNDKDVDALDELASPSYRRHLGPTRPSIDRAAQKERLLGLQRSMPDVHFSIDDLIVDVDRVVFRVTVTGTHRGELLGIPATGRKVAYSAIDILRFEADRIVEHWGFGDTGALLEQLRGDA
jgi:predicted ester cyclase